jgi:hypothetical protein
MRYIMSRQRIEHTATTTADPATVYALLREGATWPVWGPLDSFELERPGEGEPEGLGAVRIFRSGRVTGRDTVAELIQDRRFSYTHVSNLPIKNYRADVDLTPAGDGTAIRWVSAFDPKVPGTRALLRRGLDDFVAQLANGLAEHASSRSRVAG